MRTDEEMMLTFRANVEVLLEVKCVNQFAAIRALGPQVIGHALAFVACTSEFWFVEDTHLFEILCTK